VMDHGNTSDTEHALASCLEHFQQRAATIWKDREKEALIALARALDCTAASIHWNEAVDGAPAEMEQGLRRAMFLLGSAPAMRPLLLAVKDQGGGVPLGPSHADAACFAYSYLDACGTLVFLRRMAALERLGLASARQVSSGHYQIDVHPGPPEQALLQSMRSQPRDGRVIGSPRRWERLHSRMRRYVDSPDGWFIRYDNDWEIVMAYREEARLHGQGYLEAEALPDDVTIGDRTFGEWKEACDQAVGRILAHMDFAALLHKKNPSIAMENILTIFARRDDVGSVWMEAGLPREQVSPTMQALTLGFDGLDDWERAFEVPTPFYIDLGRDFVLLPCFGALTNPYFALFRHLRQAYKLDWDRAVDRREAIFRSDLGTIFPASRFMIPDHGFKLRRPDGSVITDIDAVILDKETGDLALVQLKWHDVFGFSLGERESRRKNMAKANEWVDRVSAWADNRSSRELLHALGLKAEASQRPPLLYVVARYAARFSGGHVQDPRASWLGWPEMKMASNGDQGGTSPLSQIPAWIAAHQRQFEQHGTKNMDFQFPNLKVTLQLPFSTPRPATNS
jgi:hypothetical protein